MRPQMLSLFQFLLRAPELCVAFEHRGDVDVGEGQTAVGDVAKRGKKRGLFFRGRGLYLLLAAK